MAPPRSRAKPVEVAPQPETFLEKGAETVAVSRKKVLCKVCEYFEQWSDGLCYNHWKEKEGFVFNDETGRYVRRKK